jgi:hypothetical protein
LRFDWIIETSDSGTGLDKKDAGWKDEGSGVFEVQWVLEVDEL